jgi:uncharacterized protein (TIGR00369 family)
MDPRYRYTDDLENPGWLIGPEPDSGRFMDVIGRIRARAEAPAIARLRVQPQEHHRNIVGTVHGGFLMALIDQALFIGPAILGVPGMRGGLTIDCSCQFLRPVALDPAIDLVVEVLRETGRMAFIRGIVEQDGQSVAAFSGTVRKARD